MHGKPNDLIDRLRADPAFAKVDCGRNAGPQPRLSAVPRSRSSGSLVKWLTRSGRDIDHRSVNLPF